MEKRYQVFISSTFQDLQPARQEVSQALLRADCFPAGMELFPAADEEQFAFIKQIIDQSDYYIIISAGRYGTIDEKTDLSYTEMEYDYAVDTGKPVIRLLHKDPFNNLTGDLIEQNDEAREKLETFRNKMTDGKLVRFWTNHEQLGAEVAYALMDCKKRFNATGWLPANRVASDKVISENLRLRKEISDRKNTDKVADAILGGSSFPVWESILRTLPTLKNNEIELLEEIVGDDAGYFPEDKLIVKLRELLGKDDLAKAMKVALESDGLLKLELNEIEMTWFWAVQEKGRDLLKLRTVESITKN